jgi:hypothetical protein
LPVGIFGKSGGTMAYFLKQTTVFKRFSSRFKLISSPKDLKSQGLEEDDHLILLDDIIGTGASLCDFYRKDIQPQLVADEYNIRLSILCIAYMKDASEYIADQIGSVELFGTEYIKAFASGSSPFGYRPKMLPIREFAYEYGKDLFITKDYKTGKTAPHPLGYNRSQSLIIFSHSVPNNTLPIIWSNKNGWFPLFPRHGNDKIERVKEFQREVWAAVTLAVKKDLFNIEDGKSVYDHKHDFRLLGIIKLKRRKSIVPLICHKLGISENLYNEIIQEGQKIDIFNEKGELTKHGNEIYDQTILSIKRQQKEKADVSKNSNIFEQYVPKTFLGKT